MYTKEDYLIAKLRGEIEPRYEQDFYEQHMITGEIKRIPGIRRKLPDLTMEEWLEEKNAHCFDPQWASDLGK